MEGLSLKGIRKEYGALTVFDGIDMDFEGGRITCILGPSGSGKTTLLNIISGATDYEGEITGSPGPVSYIYQGDRLIDGLTVWGNLEYVLRGAVKDREERSHEIERILDTVELAGKKRSYPRELSGGMRQRVSMARAFVYPSRLLLMDEPFRSLDIALKRRLTSAFLKLWEADKKTVVFVTHDIDEALLLSDYIYVIKGNPAKIAAQFPVPDPHGSRGLGDEAMLLLRKRLYEILG